MGFHLLRRAGYDDALDRRGGAGHGVHRRLGALPRRRGVRRLRRPPAQAGARPTATTIWRRAGALAGAGRRSRIRGLAPTRLIGGVGPGGHPARRVSRASGPRRPGSRPRRPRRPHGSGIRIRSARVRGTGRELQTRPRASIRRQHARQPVEEHQRPDRPGRSTRRASRRELDHRHPPHLRRPAARHQVQVGRRVAQTTRGPSPPSRRSRRSSHEPERARPARSKAASALPGAVGVRRSRELALAQAGLSARLLVHQAAASGAAWEWCRSGSRRRPRSSRASCRARSASARTGGARRR